MLICCRRVLCEHAKSITIVCLLCPPLYCVYACNLNGAVMPSAYNWGSVPKNVMAIPVYHKQMSLDVASTLCTHEAVQSGAVLE